MADLKASHDQDDLKSEPQRGFARRAVLLGALLVGLASFGDADAGWPLFARFVFGEFELDVGGREVSTLTYTVSVLVVLVLLFPFVGWAIDRWGPRRVAACGLAVFGLALVLFQGPGNIWVLRAVVVVSSVGGLMCGSLPMATLVNNWFQRRRATAMAAMMLVSVLVGLVVSIALQYVGSYVELVGRVAGSLSMAAFLAGLAWLTVRWLRDAPEGGGRCVDGVDRSISAEQQPGEGEAGGLPVPEYGWREALRSRAFWLLAAGGFGAEICGIVNFFGAVVVYDRGFELLHSGGMQLLGSIVSLPFVMVGGLLADRYPIRRVLFVFVMVEALGVLLLAMAGTVPLLYVSGLLYGIGGGGAMALTFVALGTYFGRRNFGVIAALFLSVLLPATVALPVAVALIKIVVEGWTALMLATALASGVLGSAYLFVGDPCPSRSQLANA